MGFSVRQRKTDIKDTTISITCGSPDWTCVEHAGNDSSWYILGKKSSELG